MITGAGALYFAEATSYWSATFVAMSIIFVVATILIITVNEPTLLRENVDILSLLSLTKIVINPFKHFFVRKYAVTILLAVIFFKLGDAMLGVVSIAILYGTWLYKGTDSTDY